MRDYRLTVDEGQRQLLLLALAQLACDRPGFDEAIWEVAEKVDAPLRAKSIYEQFKDMHRDRITPLAGFRGPGPAAPNDNTE